MGILAEKGACRGILPVTGEIGEIQKEKISSLNLVGELQTVQLLMMLTIRANVFK